MSGFNADLHITTLTNGLVLIWERKPWMKGVFCQSFVRLGSCDEDYEPDQGLCDKGLCHLLEHVLFRGSKDYSGEEIIRRTVDLGGTFDAYTDRHVTSYHGWATSENLPLLLDTMDSMIFRSEIDLKSLEEERVSVMGEVELLDSDPFNAARNASLHLLYPGHNVKFPVVGTMESVGEIRATRIREIIRGFHKPQNAVLCLSGSLPGDIEIEDMIYQYARGFSHRTRAANSEDVERNFGDPTPLIAHADVESVIPEIGNEFATVLSVPVPREKETWPYVFAVLQSILSGNSLCEMDKIFRPISGLKSFGIYPETLLDLSVLTLYATGSYSKKTVAKTKEAMIAFSKMLSKGKIEDERLETAKVNTSAKLIMGRNSDYPRDLGERQMFGDWWRLMDSDIPSIQKVDKKQVSTMLKSMFGGESQVLLQAIPE